MTRILFYFYNSVHVPVLLEIYKEAYKDQRLNIAFCLHPRQRQILAGLTPLDEAKLKKLPVSFVEIPQAWNADITFVADVIPEVTFGCGKVVNIGHGLLSKGIYFTDNKLIYRENLNHLLCVPGQYHQLRILKSNKVFIPVVATGYPKLDPLFGTNYPNRNELLKHVGLDPSKKVILYAPTYNMELSALPILWSRIKEIATPDRYLIIKLHSATLPEFATHMKQISQMHENIIYIEDADITPYLQVADVMLSDVSSAFMEFICLDKPVVLFNNPNQKEYANYDPRDIEYAWRDVGIEVSTLEEVEAAIDRSLKYPEEFSAKRKSYSQQLIANKKGNSASNILHYALSLLDKQVKSYLDESQRVLCLIQINNGNEKHIEGYIRQLYNDNSLDFNIILISSKPELINKHSLPVGTRILHNNVDINDYININDSSPEFLLYINSEVEIPERMLWRLLNHLRSNGEIESVFPMGINGHPVQDPVLRAGVELVDKEQWIQMDHQLRFLYCGDRFRAIALPSSKCWLTRMNGESAKYIISQLNNLQYIPERILDKSVIAKDVTVKYPENSVSDLSALKYPLNPEQSEETELRIQLLSEWIGKFAGQRYNYDPKNKRDDIDTTVKKASNQNSHLRLAQYYENKGKLDLAKKHIKQALEENPENKEVLEISQRLGIQ